MVSPVNQPLLPSTYIRVYTGCKRSTRRRTSQKPTHTAASLNFGLRMRRHPRASPFSSEEARRLQANDDNDDDKGSEVLQPVPQQQRPREAQRQPGGWDFIGFCVGVVVPIAVVAAITAVLYNNVFSEDGDGGHHVSEGGGYHWHRGGRTVVALFPLPRLDSC